MHKAMILEIFFNKVFRKKNPAAINIIIQLKGDKKNDKTAEASWCMGMVWFKLI
jgi:hypothetical protein